MGYIKEPDGIDFVVESRPLTTEDEAIIQAFIRASKEARARELAEAKEKRKLARRKPAAPLLPHTGS